MGYARPLESADAASQDDARALDAGRRSASGFEVFFTREWPRLRAYLRRRVGDEDAEDIAQEAFARVARAHDVRSASGLLYQAARRLVIDGKRAEGRAAAVLVRNAAIEALADPAPSPEEATHARLRLERVGDMLELMSPKCRAVFVARVVDGQSYAEIGARMSMSTKAVEKQLLRAFEICARWRGQDAQGNRGERGRRARV